MRPGEEVTDQLVTRDPYTYTPTYATGQVTGVIVVNGTDDPTITVTISPTIDVGVYEFNFIVPVTLQPGDEISLRVTATVAGVTDTAIVYRDRITSSWMAEEIAPTLIYGTIERADEYVLENCFDADTIWLAETVLNKNIALRKATRAINALSFAGEKTDPDQQHQFPRDGSTTVPFDVERACYEIAFALLDGRDIDYDNEFQQVTSVIGNVRTSSEASVASRHGVPSQTAWNLLMPYLRDIASVKLVQTT